MPMELCPNCQIPLDSGVCSKCGFKHETKIKIEVGRSAEIEAIRREKDLEIENLKLQLEEKKSILEQQALSEFEKEKKAVMELLNNSEMSYEQKTAIENQLENPANMELIRTVLGAGKPTKKPPYGKSTFLPPTDGETYESKEAMIDALYEQAFYNPLATPEQKNTARDKINSLWKSFTVSKSLAQLHDQGINTITKPVSECPNCHRTITPLTKANPTCPFCNYDVRNKNDSFNMILSKRKPIDGNWTTNGEPPK